MASEILHVMRFECWRGEKQNYNESFVGKNVEVLFDRKGRHANQYIGRSIYNQSVFTSSKENLIGTIHDMQIINSTNFCS